MNLVNTVPYMLSDNYKERFIAEYWQTKERYERLKRFCNKIEAEEHMNLSANDGNASNNVKRTPHDCSFRLLKEQQKAMGGYLHALEVRAVIEKIELAEPKAPEEPELKNSEKLTRIYTALNVILEDLDNICSDEQELLIAMNERDSRYEGKGLVLACIEQASADVCEAYEIIESILENENDT